MAFVSLSRFLYIYVYIEECIFSQQVIIQENFVNKDGTMFIIIQ